MSPQEFSKEFDIRFNFINSNLAFGVNAYEKSVYLTRAQEEILDNYFNPKGNKYQEGVDMSPKRHIDFSSLITVEAFSSQYNGSTPYSSNGKIYKTSNDTLRILNEKFSYKVSHLNTTSNVETVVVPIDYALFDRMNTKPYKYPPKKTSWRLMRSASTNGSVIIEIVHDPRLVSTETYTYTVRYLKRPTPIVVEDLPAGLSVNGVSTTTACTLVPELHNEILDRAIELCRVDFVGDAQTQIQTDTRNE